MNCTTVLSTLFLCGFSLIHCMEIAKKYPTLLEKTYEEYILLSKATPPNLEKCATLLHDLLKLNHTNQHFSLEANKLFHTHNGNLNIQSPKGYTFLMEAVRKKNIPLVKYLLENKANPNIPTHDSTYPIHLAIEFDDYYCIDEKPTEIVLEIVTLLLQYNANPNHQYSRYQVLPLDVAQLRKTEIIIEKLKKYDAKSFDAIQNENHEPQKRNS